MVVTWFDIFQDREVSSLPFKLAFVYEPKKLLCGKNSQTFIKFLRINFFSQQKTTQNRLRRKKKEAGRNKHRPQISGGVVEF